MPPPSQPLPVGPRLTAALAVVVLLAVGCGTADGTASDSADGGAVVVTTSIWADVVSNVACDGSVEIETVMPIGADAHTFEPSLADRTRLDGAALIVANGISLEEGLLDTIAGAESAGTPVLRLGHHVDTIPYSSPSGDGDHGDGDDGDDHDDGNRGDDHEHVGPAHSHEGDDPHLWFDPIRVSSVLPVVADRLVDEAGLDRDLADGCVADYQAELADLDADITDRVAGLPAERRLLVTNHDTLGYFADRYGFEVLGTVSASPAGLAETNPADLEALARTMEAAGSRTIFTETSTSVDEAEALARRLGDAEVVALFTESLGEPGDDAGTYLELLATNADRILGALA